MPKNTVLEIEACMDIKTTASVECGWCCASKSIEVDPDDAFPEHEAAKKLAQAMTWAQDDEAIGFACTQCMATGTLREMPDA